MGHLGLVGATWCYVWRLGLGCLGRPIVEVVDDIGHVSHSLLTVCANTTCLRCSAWGCRCRTADLFIEFLGSSNSLHSGILEMTVVWFLAAMHDVVMTMYFTCYTTSRIDLQLGCCSILWHDGMLLGSRRLRYLVVRMVMGLVTANARMRL